MSLPGATATREGLARLRPLLGEVNDLKRVRCAGRSGSLASQGFARSWAALLGGEKPDLVARREATLAVISAHLGAIDAKVLALAGLSPDEITSILEAALQTSANLFEPDELPEVFAPVGELSGYLRHHDDHASLPGWVADLAAQPRAGATRPGYPRLILEPAESHADHSYITAIYGVLIAPSFGSEASTPFLAGLSHHLHNAALPDSGFAGEELLGDHLVPVMTRLTALALAELPGPLADQVVEARRVLSHADIPEAKAFHAADVLDRVLQMGQFARVSAFELSQALDDLDLVHPGPLQAFQLDVLATVGLRA